MGRHVTTHTKAGLSLDDHRALAAQLRSVRAEVLAVRETIKTALGSATIAYQSFQRLLNAVGATENALLHEAVAEYVDEVGIVAIRQIYGREGA